MRPWVPRWLVQSSHRKSQREQQCYTSTLCYMLWDMQRKNNRCFLPSKCLQLVGEDRAVKTFDMLGEQFKPVVMTKVL